MITESPSPRKSGFPKSAIESPTLSPIFKISAAASPRGKFLKSLINQVPIWLVWIRLPDNFSFSASEGGPAVQKRVSPAYFGPRAAFSTSSISGPALIGRAIFFVSNLAADAAKTKRPRRFISRPAFLIGSAIFPNCSYIGRAISNS